jgi:hypothetical protein
LDELLIIPKFMKFGIGFTLGCIIFTDKLYVN